MAPSNRATPCAAAFTNALCVAPCACPHGTQAMLAVGFVEEEFNKLRELLVELDAEMIKVGRRNYIHKFSEKFNKLRERCWWSWILRCARWGDGRIHCFKKLNEGRRVRGSWGCWCSWRQKDDQGGGSPQSVGLIIC